ncbi:BnaC05g14550D [Brassica napus]|uniref:BnaC05g14550D protein n=1 Tax=Brassica napus TaxID=3708 RepID=A0A078G1A3_BRANA|nr:BnaC05g14550D [Brassica napus]
MDETGDEKNIDEHKRSGYQGLSLGFEYKDLSYPTEKFEIDHNQANTSLLVSNKTMIPSENSFGFKNDGDDHEDEEELLPQNLVKKARVSVRSRCETTTVTCFTILAGKHAFAILAGKRASTVLAGKHTLWV